MGEVCRARDPRLGREVAIKILPAEMSADRESRRSRFLVSLPVEKERESQLRVILNWPALLKGEK